MPEAAPDSVDAGRPPDEALVALCDVWKGFNGVPVLRGVSLSVAAGTTAVVMGGSGSGKSVLIKHIVRLLQPDRGVVWVDGQRMDRLAGDALDTVRLSIGYLFQSGALFDSMTAYENMDFILDRHTSWSPAERRERIEEMLAWVNLREKAGHYPVELSGGQKKRLGLARAVILNPRILLYDEPTTGLDPISVRAVSELIARLRQERGITAVAITHDLLCAEIIADTVHFLSEGRIIEQGTLAALRRSAHPHLRNFFGR